MKRMALEWFEHGVMQYNPTAAPTWQHDQKDFVTKLHTNFGLANPIGMAEVELCHLSMNHNTCLTEYLVCFNTLASHVNWGDGALCFQFYDSPPDRLKDKIAILSKPNTLWEMVQTTQQYDDLYWE